MKKILFLIIALAFESCSNLKVAKLINPSEKFDPYSSSIVNSVEEPGKGLISLNRETTGMPIVLNENQSEGSFKQGMKKTKIRLLPLLMRKNKYMATARLYHSLHLKEKRQDDNSVFLVNEDGDFRWGLFMLLALIGGILGALILILFIKSIFGH